MVRLWLLMAVAFLAVGCGDVGTPGGTSGVLRSDGNPLGDFRVTVHAGTDAVARGVSDYEGRFALVTMTGDAPVTLEAGDYAVTLESVGSPVVLPPEYAAAETTPLRITHDPGQPLELSVPGLVFPGTNK